MSTEQIAGKVRESISSRTPLRISGSGSWMTAGRPVNASEKISLAADTGVVDYVPDDLTITVRAGTTLREIAAVTRANDQWLPLDPLGGSGATIGATIATASSGPLSHSFGFVRDFILGLEFVTGKGDVVRSGGRVVKNVAGFDLMRLTCGAWGTLGVITEASLRLYAIPKVDRTFALEMPEGAANLETFLELLRNSALGAFSLELLSASLAARCGLPRREAVLARLAGNAKLVDAQMKTLGDIGSFTEVETGIWALLADAHAAAPTFSLRLSCLPTGASHDWHRARQLLARDDDAFSHSTFSRGITRVVGFAGDGVTVPRSAPGRRVAYEILPATEWASLSPSVTGDRLSVNVKRAYDPHCILNPGILG